MIGEFFVFVLSFSCNEHKNVTTLVCTNVLSVDHTVFHRIKIGQMFNSKRNNEEICAKQYDKKPRLKLARPLTSRFLQK